MAAAAAGGAGAVDPVSAIAQAAGEMFKTIGAGLGILKGRDEDLSARNAREFGYAQMENATNAQRLYYLQSSQQQGTKTLLIVSSMFAVIVVAFLLAHKHA